MSKGDPELRHGIWLAWAKTVLPLAVSLVVAFTIYLALRRYQRGVEDRELATAERRLAAEREVKILEQFLQSSDRMPEERLPIAELLEAASGEPVRTWAAGQKAELKKEVDERAAARTAAGGGEADIEMVAPMQTGLPPDAKRTDLEPIGLKCGADGFTLGPGQLAINANVQSVRASDIVRLCTDEKKPKCMNAGRADGSLLVTSAGTTHLVLWLRRGGSEQRVTNPICQTPRRVRFEAADLVVTLDVAHAG